MSGPARTRGACGVWAHVSPAPDPVKVISAAWPRPLGDAAVRRGPDRNHRRATGPVAVTSVGVDDVDVAMGGAGGRAVARERDPLVVERRLRFRDVLLVSETRLVPIASMLHRGPASARDRRRRAPVDHPGRTCRSPGTTC